MTEVPRDMPVTRLLENASGLLGATAGDAHELQTHLTDMIGSERLSNLSAEEVQLLQSLDRLTQTLDGMAAAFSIASREFSNGTVEDWASVLGELKLEQVGQMLTFGSTWSHQAEHTELF